MIEYKVLKEIENNPAHTQRTLAQTLNISLGKANYVLSGLIDKGTIKARRLKNHPDRIRWNYILTPRGIKEKIKLTKNYLEKRLEEYNQIQREIASLQKEVEMSEPVQTKN
jgi:EPS-associated MarR family transcriptional regulator